MSEDNILQFTPRRHSQGEAICAKCKHEWQAVAPIGVACLECPKCKVMSGMWKWPFGCPVGDAAYLCNCGCEYFHIYKKTKTGEIVIECRQCGASQNPFEA